MCNHDEKKWDPQSRLERDVEEVAGKGKQKVRVDDSLVMRKRPARTCGADYTWDSCSFTLNVARDSHCECSRFHQRMGEVVKISDKKKQLLDDRDWR